MNSLPHTASFISIMDTYDIIFAGGSLLSYWCVALVSCLTVTSPSSQVVPPLVLPLADWLRPTHRWRSWLVWSIPHYSNNFFLKIQILDAGPHTRELQDHIQPARYLSNLMLSKETFTFHQGKPSKALLGRSPTVPCGRAVGGGSTVNCELMGFSS